MQQDEILKQLQTEISEIRKTLQARVPYSPFMDKWVPRDELMRFLRYGPTQMASIEKTGNLVTAKVGKRKFYLRESVEKLLERSIITNSPDSGRLR